jgi:hypothetical protein
MRFKGLKLKLLVDWARKAGVDVPDPYGSGEDVAKWFKNGQYYEIIKHLERDLTIIGTVDLNSGIIYKTIS